MPIDPHAARLLRMLGAAGSQAGRVSIVERRRAFDGLMRLSGAPPAGVVAEERSLAGPGGPLRVRVLTPAGPPAGPLPGLVYFHGGGLVAGSLESYDGLCRTLSHHSGCRVLAVDYRLAPEHPFPSAVEDARWVSAAILDDAEAFGLDPDRVAIGGDSAGGTLTAIVTQALRSRAGRRPCCQLLLCPVLDFAAVSPSKRAFGQGYLLDTSLMERDLEDLGSKRPLDDPLISPLRAADFAGLPPALIHTAGFDPLRDEGHAYAERARQAGVEVRYTCHDSMVHHFYGLGGMIPATAAILAQIGAELKTAIAGR